MPRLLRVSSHRTVLSWPNLMACVYQSPLLTRRLITSSEHAMDFYVVAKVSTALVDLMLPPVSAQVHTLLFGLPSYPIISEVTKCSHSLNKTCKWSGVVWIWMHANTDLSWEEENCPSAFHPHCSPLLRINHLRWEFTCHPSYATHVYNILVCLSTCIIFVLLPSSASGLFLSHYPAEVPHFSVLCPSISINVYVYLAAELYEKRNDESHPIYLLKNSSTVT